MSQESIRGQFSHHLSPTCCSREKPLLLSRSIFTDNTSNFNRLLYHFGSKCSAAQLECSTKCPFRQPTTLHCCFCVISPSSQPICFQTERKKKPSLSTHVASNTFQITHLYNLSKQKRCTSTAGYYVAPSYAHSMKYQCLFSHRTNNFYIRMTMFLPVMIEKLISFPIYIKS